MKRLAKRTSEDAAPAWFGPAMQPFMNELRQIRNDVAIVNNRSSAHPSHPIMPVPRNAALPAAVLPDAFPQTMAALRDMRNNELLICLNYYDLSTNGTTNEKKKRLAEHLGAMMVS